jgi:hypothetical protein
MACGGSGLTTSVEDEPSLTTSRANSSSCGALATATGFVSELRRAQQRVDDDLPAGALWPGI